MHNGTSLDRITNVSLLDQPSAVVLLVEGLKEGVARVRHPEKN